MTHYSSVKKRWSWSHAQLPPTTRIHAALSGSPWNSTKKKKNNTDWMTRLFFFLHSLPESQRLHQSPRPPASFHAATFSGLQDTLPQTLPSSSLPHPCPHTYDMIAKGAGRMSKTRWRRKKAPGSLNCHRWAASENVQAQHFFTEETPCFHGRWNLERQTEEAVCYRGKGQTEGPQGAFVLSYPAMIAAINQSCGVIFSTTGHVLASYPPSVSLLQLTT